MAGKKLSPLSSITGIISSSIYKQPLEDRKEKSKFFGILGFLDPDINTKKFYKNQAKNSKFIVVSKTKN